MLILMTLGLWGCVDVGDFRKIRAIDRSDCTTFMGFCKADRGDQSTWLRGMEV